MLASTTLPVRAASAVFRIWAVTCRRLQHANSDCRVGGFGCRAVRAVSRDRLDGVCHDAASLPGALRTACRRVTIYPRTDPSLSTFLFFEDLVDLIRRQYDIDITVDPILENHATADQKERCIDILEFLIEN